MQQAKEQLEPVIMAKIGCNNAHPRECGSANYQQTNIDGNHAGKNSTKDAARRAGDPHSGQQPKSTIARNAMMRRPVYEVN